MKLPFRHRAVARSFARCAYKWFNFEVQYGVLRRNTSSAVSDVLERSVLANLLVTEIVVDELSTRLIMQQTAKQVINAAN